MIDIIKFKPIVEKEKVMVLGGSVFYDNILFDSLKNSKVKTMSNLYKKYDVDNLSNKNLCTEKAIRFYSTFKNIRNYKSIVIQLGEYEITNNIKLEEFKTNLEELVKRINESSSKIILVGLTARYLKIDKRYNDAIIDIAKKYKVEFISLVSEYNFRVVTDSALNKALKLSL